MVGVNATITKGAVEEAKEDTKEAEDKEDAMEATEEAEETVGCEATKVVA